MEDQGRAYQAEAKIRRFAIAILWTTEQCPAYARGIENVIDSVESLLKRGHARAVRELAERALQRMEAAMDEGGWLHEEILERWQEVHLAACQVEKPDPSALAKLFSEWEINSAWEVFLGAAETYWDVLGKTGLAEYRKLAEAK